MKREAEVFPGYKEESTLNFYSQAACVLLTGMVLKEGEKMGFRTMRRFKQQLLEEECIEVLRSEKRGVLSVMGEGGYPYGMPLNHWYCEEDGKLYFHGAREGHRVDSIQKNSKVSYCVYNQGDREPGDWVYHVKSVVVFGEMKLVEDLDKTREICIRLVKKFTDDQEYLEKELQNALPRVQCFVLTPEHMTGKLVKES